MNEHEEIRNLLTLAVAGALDEAEEARVFRHARNCSECAKEMESWNSLASGLRALPTPQPSAALLQKSRALAEARFQEEAEARWQRNVMVFVVAFGWVLAIVSWPLVRLVSGGLLDLLSPELNQSWMSFVLVTAVVWLTGGTATVLLALNQRRERRLA